MVRLSLRAFRHPSTPAKLLLAALVLILFLGFPRRDTPHTSLSYDELVDLWNMTRDEVGDTFERVRIRHLEQVVYDADATAYHLRAPMHLPDGTPTLSASIDEYTHRLSAFIFHTLSTSPSRVQLEDAVDRVASHAPPSESLFGCDFFSTDRLGDAGVPDLFRLWTALLPLRLEPELTDLLPETDWTAPARKGRRWKVVIADDMQMHAQATEWLGESLTSAATGDWALMWRALETGAHHADLYKYLAMLFQGGLYADSDTAPIAHPFLWGLNAPSILYPDLDAIDQVLRARQRPLDESSKQMWALRSRQYEGAAATARQVRVGLKRDVAEPPPPTNATVPEDDPQAPVIDNEMPQEATTILSPEINVVVALEWDSSLTWTFGRWPQWTKARYNRSWRNSGPGRNLQFAQHVFAAKPFHPIFLDTVATIMELVDAGRAETLDSIDLTGPGPFTDAVLRYLLVRYGVTPDQLLDLKGPVRVGDVLILQEEALLAPDEAMVRMLEHVQEFFPSMPGSGLAKAVPGHSLWYWGTGYQSWNSGGQRVVYHGNGKGSDHVGGSGML